jgi:Cu+-exporting ATPase
MKKIVDILSDDNKLKNKDKGYLKKYAKDGEVGKKVEEGEEEAVGCSCCSCDSESSLVVEGEGEGKESEEQKSKKIRYEKLLIILGLALTIPLVIIETFLSQERFLILVGNNLSIDTILLFLATPVQIILGWPFYKRFYNSLKRKRGFTVDTLVVLSTTVAYTYSIIAMAMGLEIRFFEASASVLTIFTIGEYVESKVLGTTYDSIKKLVALKPKTTVIIKSDGKQQTVDVDDIIRGDIFIVKPGESIATDGIVVFGNSSVDESMITGESIPIDKKMDDKVIGGTINKNGYLHIKATSVGNQTVLANIIEMVRKARASKKPSIQRIADKCAKYFIPSVLIIAFVSSLSWLLIAHESISFVITVFATILVVSCPCALGIATPMVVSLGIGKAAKEGVLIKGGRYLEKLASIDIVIFDKTGTLTNGKPMVTEIVPNDNYSEFDVLQLASSVEIKSEHPIAQAIVKKASEKGIPPLQVTEFIAIAGNGVIAKYKEGKIFVGSPQLYNNTTTTKDNHYQNSSSSQEQKLHSKSKIFELEAQGKTVVTVFVDDNLIGIIAVADTLRDNAISVVKQIQSMGKQVILLTGDNKRTAKAIAKKLNIENVLSDVLPQSKAEKIKNLQEQKGKKKVAMVGDGINDALALTQADVGIAMSSGTDVAIASGHVILVKNDLQDIVYAFKLSQYSLNKIKQNLTISFAYNSISISIAAGIFYGITNSLILTPALAAVGWIISDSIVFGNSLFVNEFKLNYHKVPIGDKI